MSGTVPRMMDGADGYKVEVTEKEKTENVKISFRNVNLTKIFTFKRYFMTVLTTVRYDSCNGLPFNLATRELPIF
jgi:hypothetical protein